MAVEVAKYNVRHVSASKWMEQELFSSVGGLDTECITKPGSPIVMKSILSSS